MNRIALVFGGWCLAALLRALVGTDPISFYEATIAGAAVVMILGYRHEAKALARTARGPARRATDSLGTSGVGLT